MLTRESDHYSACLGCDDMVHVESLQLVDLGAGSTLRRCGACRWDIMRARKAALAVYEQPGKAETPDPPLGCYRGA